MTGNYERAQMCSLAVLGNMRRCGGVSYRLYDTVRRTDLDVFVSSLFRTNTKLLIGLRTLLVFTYIFSIGMITMITISTFFADVCNDADNPVTLQSWKNSIRQKKTSDPSFSALYPSSMDIWHLHFTSIRGNNQGSWPRKASNFEGTEVGSQ